MVKTLLNSSKLLILHSNDLLDQSIIENGILKPNYQYGSVYESMLEIAQIAETLIGRKQLKLDLQLDSVKDLDMKFDKQRLQQVVHNLTSNAFKFTQ